MQYMMEKLESWQISGDAQADKIQFHLFFPNEGNGQQHSIQTIQVCGDFQKALGQPDNWDPATDPALTRTAHPEGEIESNNTAQELHANFYQYKYYVTYNNPGEQPCWVSDPYARYGGEKNMDAVVVVGGSLPADNFIATLARGAQAPARAGAL